MPEPLDIRHLRYFLAVAEAGSFSRAADRLGISQPSVSQQMRDLEAGLRVPLFQRRGKRILLTPRGLIFQEHARAVLHQLENFLQDLNSEPGELRGALRLGVIPVLNVPLVPQLLGSFVADYPAISITVEEISSTEIETALEEGRMDVGLGFLTRHSPNLRYERLCTDEFALIVGDNGASFFDQDRTAGFHGDAGQHAARGVLHHAGNTSRALRRRGARRQPAEGG